MTAPIDPRLVARLSDEFAALSQQLLRAGQDLNHLRTQLQPPAPQPMPQPVPRPLPQPPVQPWPPVYQQQPRFAPPPQMPPQPPQPAQPPQPLRPPLPKRDPWWQRDGVVSRILAVAGTAVTLIGVAMLLVLAAQAGFFGPVARVASGAALAAALVGAGIHVFGRPGGRVGGIALAATGIAAAYLDVVAIAVIYGWLEPPIALAVALGVAALGVALAAKWKAETLALLVVVPVAILAPVVTDGITLTLVGFLIVLQIGCYPVQLIHRWAYLHVARTVPAVLAIIAGIAATAFDSATTDYRYWLLASAVVVAAFGLGSAVVSVLRDKSEVTVSAMLAVSAVPLLLTSAMFDRPLAIGVQTALAIVMLTVAAASKLPNHTRIAALVPAIPALLQVAFQATDYDTHSIGLIVVALGFFGAAVQSKSQIAYYVGVGFSVVAGLAYLVVTSPDTLSDKEIAVRDLSAATIVASVLALALIAAALWSAHRIRVLTRSNAEGVWILVGLAGLYVLTAGIVAAAVEIDGARGFTAGHCTATIGWMIAATALLLYSLRGAASANLALGAGLTLTAAAIAKLFLFDLATLDGLTRVAAFIAVGLLLLAVGTRYARAFAEIKDAKDAKDAADASAAR